MHRKEMAVRRLHDGGNSPEANKTTKKDRETGRKKRRKKENGIGTRSDCPVTGVDDLLDVFPIVI